MEVEWTPHKESFAITKQVMRNKNLKPSSKNLMMLLYAYAGINSECFPSKETLMSDLNISRRTFYYSIDELKAENFIEFNGTKRIKMLPVCAEISTEESAKNCVGECNFLQHSNEDNQLRQSKRNIRNKVSDVTLEQEFQSQEQKKPKLLPISKQVQHVMDYYYSVIDKTVPDPDAIKTLNNIISVTKQALNGTMFNGDLSYKGWNRAYTIKEIKEAIDMHALSLKEEYYPTDKKTVLIHLDKFLYNPFAKQNKSFLVKWLYDPPKKIPQLIVDNGDRGVPLYIDTIKRLHGWNGLTPPEMDKLVTASLWIHRYFERHKTRFTSPEGVHKGSVAQFISKIAEVKKQQMKDIRPGFYASNYFLKEYLPECCQKEGIIRK